MSALSLKSSNSEHPAHRQDISPALECVVPTGPTDAEIRVARQKALFVERTYDLSTAKKITLKTACGLAAAHADDFPDLVHAGKSGASLIADTRAWNNYRSWAGKLGRVKGSRKPDTSNWTSLLARYAGSRRYVRPGDDKFWIILRKLYEHPNRLSLKYAYELAEVAYNSVVEKTTPPTYAQVRHWYSKHAEKKTVLIARMGEEWYRNNIASYITREAPGVDECWVGDHHIFDAAIRVYDEEAGAWRAVRPWITAWVDWGSLYFAGWQIRAIYPNRDSIERSLKQAITANGYHAPEHMYIDNGKDYKAAGFAVPVNRLSRKDEDRLRTVAALLGCTPHFAIPYNARAKIIERLFRPVCEQFSKLWTSYRGSDPTKRPTTADEAWKHPETLPTLDEFTVAFQTWLTDIYHRRPSNGAILSGKSPLEARAQTRRNRPALAPQVVYKAFLREVKGGCRKIMRGGVVRALNRFYQSDELWQLLDGKAEVRVKVDPDDLSTIWVFTPEGREIGPAREVPKLPALIDPDDAKTVEDLREQMRRQRREVRQAKAGMVKMQYGAGELVPFLPPPRNAGTPAPSSPARNKEPDIDIKVDKDLSDDLDAALREETEARLAELNNSIEALIE